MGRQTPPQTLYNTTDDSQLEDPLGLSSRLSRR